MSKKKELTFEESMAHIEKIVEQLEAGDVPLEKAIELYKEGMEFSKICSDKLQHIEEQIHHLTEKDVETDKKEEE